MHRGPPSRAICALLVLGPAGCGGELASDYTLSLVPHSLTGQAPFEGDRTVELVLTDTSGVSTVHYLGPVTAGEVRGEALPPIPAGATVGVLVEEAGGAQGAHDEDLAVAWGAVSVPDALATGDQQVALDVLVPEIYTLGEMGSLGAAKLRVGAGVAMIPGGDTFVFGGADSPTGTPSDAIFRMSNVDGGDWAFEKLSERLPEQDGITARYGVAAITIEDDGQPLIFVTGGRDDLVLIPGSETTDAFLFDPATDTVVWGDKAAHDTMLLGRSEHQMLLMDNGKVLIYGGYDNLLSASYEVFNPANKRFESGSGAFGEAGAAAASLGAGGAMICGGADFGPVGNPMSPIDTCSIVTLSGAVTDASPLSDAVMGHAMAQLADGQILATGGITTSAAQNDPTPAVRNAWLFNGTQWGLLSANMKEARVHHQIIPLPDGNALILGGTELGGPAFNNPNTSVLCPEIYDARSQTFSKLSTCSSSGAGANPGWSAVDGEGVFVLAGVDTFDPLGGSFGFFGFGPDITASSVPE